MVDVHSGIGFSQIICIILVELRGLIRNYSSHSALVAVFEPKQIQCDTAALALLIDVGGPHIVAVFEALGGNSCSESCLSHISAVRDRYRS